MYKYLFSIFLNLSHYCQQTSISFWFAIVQFPVKTIPQSIYSSFVYIRSNKSCFQYFCLAEVWLLMCPGGCLHDCSFWCSWATCLATCCVSAMVPCLCVWNRYCHFCLSLHCPFYTVATISPFFLLLSLPPPLSPLTASLWRIRRASDHHHQVSSLQRFLQTNGSKWRHCLLHTGKSPAQLASTVQQPSYSVCVHLQLIQMNVYVC